MTAGDDTRETECEVTVVCNRCGYKDEFTSLLDDVKSGDTWEQPCNDCGYNFHAVTRVIR